MLDVHRMPVSSFGARLVCALRRTAPFATWPPFAARAEARGKVHRVRGTGHRRESLGLTGVPDVDVSLEAAENLRGTDPEVICTSSARALGKNGFLASIDRNAFVAPIERRVRDDSRVAPIATIDRRALAVDWAVITSRPGRILDEHVGAKRHR
ncbi:MAG: hypothetical protein ACLP01_24785 [Solirubrobacteraceae bacterium]